MRSQECYLSMVLLTSRSSYEPAFLKNNKHAASFREAACLLFTESEWLWGKYDAYLINAKLLMGE